MIGSLYYSICTTKYLCCLILHSCVSVPTIDSSPTLVPSLVKDNMILLFSFTLNLGWWISATLCNTGWMYCCPDGAPDSANPTSRYGINCCKTEHYCIIDLVSMRRLCTGTSVLHATLHDKYSHWPDD